jgi:hypothetical protein
MISTLTPDGQEARLEVMAAAVLIDGQIRLRAYAGPDLLLDAPISRRRALVLACDLLTIATGLKLRERSAPAIDDGYSERGSAG